MKSVLGGGITSTTKQNLKNHLRKKKICTPLYADIDRELYISQEHGAKSKINKDVSSFCHHFNKPERHHLSSSVNILSSFIKNKPNMSSFIKNSDDTLNNSDLTCIFCNKVYSSRQSKRRHEKICSNRNSAIMLKMCQILFRLKLKSRQKIL